MSARQPLEEEAEAEAAELQDAQGAAATVAQGTRSQEEVELAAFAEAFVVGASAGRGGAAWGGGALVVHSQVRRQL